eukprot:snap_masked-scaffold_22-processed-gene-4.14-mRNA-1 protein AED:1.00 eAED:1.00 QI:0/0/0/0/1/1/2/0/394
MCMTNFGKTFPEKELCGAHGTCLEGVCVCDTNWGNSIDLAPVVALNQGAREIFESATANLTSISVDEFEHLLIRSSPCSRIIPFRNGLYSVSFLFSLFAAFYFITRIKTRADLRKTAPQMLSLVLIMIDAFLKIAFQENVSFPFSFFPALVIASIVVYFQISVYDFFCKYSKYHLIKARHNFGLEVKFLGINLEKFLVYQIHYSKYFEIIFYSGTFFVPPILIQVMRQRNEFDFDLFLIAHKLIIAQWIIGSCIVLFLFLLTQAVFGGLLSDLKALKLIYEKSPEYSSRLRERAQSFTAAKQTILENNIRTLQKTRILVSNFVISCILSYIAWFVFPPSQLAFQYIGPGLVGLNWPFICVFAAIEEERKTELTSKESKLLTSEDAVTTKSNRVI